LANTSATYSAYEIYRMNSIYDPDQSSSITKNTRAFGLITMALIYNKYRVYSIDVKLTAINVGAEACRVTLYPYNQGTPTTGTVGSDYSSRLFSKTLLLGPPGSSKDTGVLTAHYDLKKTFGMSKQEFYDEQYASTTDSNPTTNRYMAVTVSDMVDQVGTVSAVHYSIDIIYNVLFYDPKENQTTI